MSFKPKQHIAFQHIGFRCVFDVRGSWLFFVLQGIVSAAETTTSSGVPPVKLDAASSLPNVEESDWETAFAAGVSESKNAIEAT